MARLLLAYFTCVRRCKYSGEEENMYTKFNYSPAGSFYNQVINRHLEHGRAIYKSHEEEVQDCLSRYITEDGVINGTALKEHWFSISKKNVFISRILQIDFPLLISYPYHSTPC